MPKSRARQALDAADRKAKAAAKSRCPPWLTCLNALLWQRLPGHTAGIDTMRSRVLARWPAPSLETAYRLGGRDSLEALVRDVHPETWAR